MSYAYEEVKSFWDYLEYYPEEDEEGFDGVHYGGVKGIRADAPQEAKKEYEKWREEEDKNRLTGILV